MKKTFYFLLLLPQLLFAQLHDNQWALGFQSNRTENRFFYRFDAPLAAGPEKVLREDNNSTGLYTASFCDSAGNILLFTNGWNIFNAKGEIIENGDSLHQPTLPQFETQLSYPFGQSAFFLQDPDSQSIVYLISMNYGEHPANMISYLEVGTDLMVHTIKITAGEAIVLEKNRVLLSGTLMAPTACRHANGRDWWIMVSDADNNFHYRILLSPLGFSTVQVQNIGNKPNTVPVDGSNAYSTLTGNCFSPDGRFYVDINDVIGFSVFEFDRCTGLLSKERRFNFAFDMLPQYLGGPIVKYYRHTFGSGATFSSDSRFMFVGSGWDFGNNLIPVGVHPLLLQFDLSNDVLGSPDTIVNPFGYATNLSRDAFVTMEMGPDGKIYLNTYRQDSAYHTIQYSNLKGKACKLVYNTPYFGEYINRAMPYMPNYHLGPLDGSPCDTLGLNNVPVAYFRIDDTLGAQQRYFYDLSHHEPATWAWDFGDGSQSTERSPLHQFPGNGKYEVCLTVQNPYGASTFCRNVWIGITDAPPVPESALSLQFSPNPFKDMLRINISAAGQLRLRDATGRLVLERACAEGVQEISTAQWVPGVYYWQFMGASGQSASGVVVKG